MNATETLSPTHPGMIEVRDRVLTINYQFGSIPAKGYEKSEPKRAGGLLGGHITCTIGQSVYGFTDEGANYTHVFPNHNDPAGFWQKEDITVWGNKMFTEQYMQFCIPVTESQLTMLQQILDGYAKKTPYDYAFFGMRCMSAMYDVLGDIAILPIVPNWYVWAKYFYPRKFRRDLTRMAYKNGWVLQFIKGRDTRQWEIM